MRGALLLALLLASTPAWAGPGETSTTSTPAAAPPAAPSLPESTSAPAPEVWVKLQDQRVFALRRGRTEEPVERRAQRVSRALEAAAQDPSAPSEPKLVTEGQRVVVFLGERPIVQLDRDDAALAQDASLEIHAKATAALIQAAVERERIRAQISNLVFSASLLVFAGLIAFLLLRRLGQLGALAHRHLVRQEDNLPPLSVSGIEVLSPAMVRAMVVTTVSIGTRLAQVGIVYLWLVFSLSLFERTKGTAEGLREVLLGPLGELIGRSVRALPLLLVLVLAVLALSVLIRFVGLFFASVTRGETKLSWLPDELAAPTSVLLRAGLVLAFLITAGPLILGSSDLVSSMIGIVALLSVGLGSTPLLATAIIGVVVIFGRRYHVGDYVEVGAARGRIRRLSILELRLIDDAGHELRVPHLLALLRGTRVHGPRARATITLFVEPTADLSALLKALAEVGARAGGAPTVHLVALDRRGAQVELSIEADDPAAARTRLYAEAAARLRSDGHALGENTFR